MFLSALQHCFESCLRVLACVKSNILSIITFLPFRRYSRGWRGLMNKGVKDIREVMCIIKEAVFV
jgi:hypothetical protein